jgi:hypothetical protein
MGGGPLPAESSIHRIQVQFGAEKRARVLEFSF